MKTFLSFAVSMLSTYCCAQLNLGSGTLLTGSGSFIVLNDMGLQHNATSAVLNHTFKFTGNNPSSINGTTQPLFTNVQIAMNGATKVFLQRSVVISQSLTFQSGLLDLNNNNIDLGTTGILNGESETSRLMSSSGGYAQISTVLNAPTAINAGNLGAIISSSQNLGNTIIKRGHNSQTNSSGGGNSILRYYDIAPTNNNSLNATFRFTYFDAEGNGLTENLLEMWKSTDNIHWNDLGFTTRNTGSNYVEKTGITDFSRWTLSTPGNPLPLAWNSFTTQCLNNQAVIGWKTETESNTRSFTIERSTDAIAWKVIGSLPAAGNSTTAINYSFTDTQPLDAGLYRIVQQDINGQTKISPVLKINCGGKDNFIVYPNPAHSDLWLSVYSAANRTALTYVYDEKGSLLKQEAQTLQRGTNLLLLNVSNYPAGNYVLILQMGTEKKTARFTKE